MRISRLVNTLDVIDYIKLVISEVAKPGVVYQSFDKVKDLPEFLANLAFNPQRPKFAFVKDQKVMSALDVEKFLEDDACELMEDKIILEIFIDRVKKGLPIYFIVKQVENKVITEPDLLSSRDADHYIGDWEKTDLYTKLVYINRPEYFSNRNLIDLVIDKKVDDKNG